MAEKLISPGVFTQENDLSFVPRGISEIGGAIVGPTVKGPALVPTLVTSYPEYVQLFGDTFTSGSTVTEYLTSISAREYLKHSGALTVVRILGDTYANASSSVASAGASVGLGRSSGSMTLIASDVSSSDGIRVIAGSTTVTFIGQVNPDTDASDDSIRFFEIGASIADYANNFVSEFNAVSSLSNWTAESPGSTGYLAISGSAVGTQGNNLTAFTGSGGSYLAGITLNNGTDTAGTSITSFKLNTIADGAAMNSSGSAGINDLLTNGSKDNLRYEISNVSDKKGTFTLLIRRGDDTSKRKTILETWSGLSLDPNSNTFISKMIGDQYQSIAQDGGVYLQPKGNFPNKSKYLYISDVTEIPDYLDANGATSSVDNAGKLPALGTGYFSGASDGTKVTDPANFFESISNTNVQGLDPNNGAKGKTSYENAIDLLSNADEYDVNMIWMPGLNAADHSVLTNKLITACETRGDCFAVIDPCLAGQTLSTATTVGQGLDTSYAAMYWPWVQTSANGKFVWVPPSTLIPGIYAFNDKVAAEWYAPAGLNRGGLETVVQAERKLTHANRDTLYEDNINPLATFPGEGVVVWGQKTLQKKASALDRVNVRRLLINLKKFIASTSKYLVFENNTAATRNRFLGSVNPYMEAVQQKQGLYAFKVVMDESNNTPDLIDRNIMKGEIYLQPAKAAEFIVVDFNIMPTGATFED
jgi:phage tail sheath protein FI